MHFIDIQYHLRKRDVSQDDIAARTRYSKALVSMVIRGTVRNRKISRAISRAIGLPVDQVFPPADGLKKAA